MDVIEIKIFLVKKIYKNENGPAVYSSSVFYSQLNETKRIVVS